MGDWGCWAALASSPLSACSIPVPRNEDASGQGENRPWGVWWGVACGCGGGVCAGEALSRDHRQLPMPSIGVGVVKMTLGGLGLLGRSCEQPALGVFYPCSTQRGCKWAGRKQALGCVVGCSVWMWRGGVRWGGALSRSSPAPDAIDWRESCKDDAWWL